MNVIFQDLLIAFGGNAMLLLLLGYLFKGLITQWLAKDLEKHKTDLKSHGDLEIEKLKSALFMASTDHQIRFAGLHAKRGEVIDRLYGDLQDVHSVVTKYVFSGSNRIKDTHKVATKVNELRYYFRKSWIYLTKETCKSFEVALDPVHAAFIRVDVYDVGGEQLVRAVNVSGDQVIPESNDDYFIPRDPSKEELRELLQLFDDRIPMAMDALEDEFRGILGVDKH